MTTTPSSPEFMTLKELRVKLGISMTSAYELARKNELPIPAVRIGRQFRFSRSAFAQLVSESQSSPVSE